MFAAAIAGGDLHIEGGVPHHLDIVLDKLVAVGGRDRAGRDRLHRARPRRLTSFDVATLPYPGFPTDLQPFAMALAAVSAGTAMITENVFEARFMFAQELARLGADLRTDGHHAVVRGVPMLSGRPSSPTTSGPVRPWCSPGWPRRAPPWSPSPSTSTAGIRGSPRRSPRSARRSPAPRLPSGHRNRSLSGRYLPA